jgi:peptide/nickel transport system permease protein
LLEVLKEDYIRTARAKGMKRWTIILRHALTNALAPVITVLGLQFGTMLSGALITEAVFAWPGLGSLGLNGLLTRDYALAQAVVVFTGLLVVLTNLFSDMLVALIDPRVRGDVTRRK